jgi:hypothetical protein
VSDQLLFMHVHLISLCCSQNKNNLWAQSTRSPKLTMVMELPGSSHTKCVWNKNYQVVHTPNVSHKNLAHNQASEASVRYPGILPCPAVSAILLRSSPTARRLASLLSWNQRKKCKRKWKKKTDAGLKSWSKASWLRGSRVRIPLTAWTFISCLSCLV